MTRCVRALCGLVAVGALACAGGCGERQTDTPSPADEPHVYTVRGEIISVPSADKPLADLEIRHEAIPDFKHADNVVHGMKSMIMPFPVDEAVTLDGIEIGDLVQFTFETVWGENYPDYRVTEITELPAETKLDFTSDG